MTAGIRVLSSVAVVVALGACPKSAKPRPKTATELCQAVVKGTAAADLTCTAVSNRDELIRLHAVEFAAIMRRLPNNAETRVGFVVYGDGIPRSDVQGEMLVRHNEAAKVSLYLGRGELPAADWEKIAGEISALTVE